MKKKAVYLLLFLLLILTLLLWFYTKAFASLHSAGSLLQMPKQENVFEEVDDVELQGIQYYLPTGATLISPFENTDNNIVRIDFNNDNQEELLYCYTNYESNNEIGLSVLNYEAGVWFKALQIDKELLDLDFIQLSDVTGDGNLELLIGWKEKNSECNGLDIYTWKNDEFVNIYSTAYSKLMIDNQRNDNQFGDRDKLVIWKENGHFYNVDVITWNNSNFISVADYFSEDFIELVKYYEKNETSYRGQSEYWYLRACACMLAREYSKANDCIDKAMSFDIDETDLLLYRVVKINCQALLTENAETEKTFLCIIDDIKKAKDLRTQNTLLMDAYYSLGRYYYNVEDYTNAYNYYDLSMKCCEVVYGDNNEVLKLKAFKISKARIEAAAVAFSKTNRSIAN